MSQATYRDGVSGAAAPDVYIYSATPTTNNDGSAILVIGYSFGAYRILIDFDVSALGSVTVTSASLTFEDFLGGGAGAGSFYRVLQDWVETSATWNKYSANNWDTAGGSTDGTDVKSSGSGNDAPVAYSAIAATTGTKTFTGLGPMVQDAVDSRAGKVRLQMKQTTESGSANTWFYAGEDATASNRPQLTVDYTAGGGAPAVVYLRRALLGVGLALAAVAPRLSLWFRALAGERRLIVRRDPGGVSTVIYDGPVIA